MEGASYRYKPLKGKNYKNIYPENKGAYKKAYKAGVLNYVKMYTVDRDKNDEHYENRK